MASDHLDVDARRRQSEPVLASGRRQGDAGAPDDQQQSVSDVDHARRQHIALFGAVGTTNAMDLFTVGINDPRTRRKPLIACRGMDFGAEMSPDGKWLAYHSNNSGEFQVYVRPFPNVQGWRTQISTAGGTRAAWSRNGRELFYLDRDGSLTSVPVLPPAGATFAAGPPERF